MVVVAVAGWQRGECVVNLSRGSREDFVLIILIVKLCGPVGPQPWFLLLKFKRVFHVKSCVTCACCLCYSAAYLLVEAVLKVHHKWKGLCSVHICRVGEFVQRIVAVQPQQSGIRALVCLCKLLSFLW